MANINIEIEMENGSLIKAELYPEVAPITVENFVKLAKDLDYKVEEKDGNVYIFTDTYEELWKNIGERKTGAWDFNLFGLNA